MGKKGSSSAAKTAADAVTNTVVKNLFVPAFTMAFHVAWHTAAIKIRTNIAVLIGCLSIHDLVNVHDVVEKRKQAAYRDYRNTFSVFGLIGSIG